MLSTHVSTVNSRKGKTFGWDMRKKPLEELRKSMSIGTTHPREKYKKIDLENLLKYFKNFLPTELIISNCTQGELGFGLWT